MFWVTAEICIFGMICYALLADGEVQDWARDDDVTRLEEDKSEEHVIN